MISILKSLHSKLKDSQSYYSKDAAIKAFAETFDNIKFEDNGNNGEFLMKLNGKERILTLGYPDEGKFNMASYSDDEFIDLIIHEIMTFVIGE